MEISFSGSFKEPEKEKLKLLKVRLSSELTQLRVNKYIVNELEP